MSEAAGALSKFLGRGSAHEGAHHWRSQRISALALVPLTLWFLYSLLRLPDYQFDTLIGWLSSPWQALWMSLLVGCIAWHSQAGVQVVVEDYVHGKVAKPLTLLVSAFAHVVAGAAGVFAVLSVAFKG
ncbi:MAG: succinate dehydrogenase, hydrophobic membrane anchor protein [Steroidobacteraceae bacterium]